ncbi:unnamed protein product [Urochloa humidicola]
MAPAASSWVPPTLLDCEGYDGAALLDLMCYIADLPNATTAGAATSTGLPLQVSFHAARPPLLSHLCVHCPGLDFSRSAPRVVATDAGLVLLRVPVNPTSHIVTIRSWDWDYFLYSPRARQLRLLPNPQPESIADSATALLSIGGGGSFAVAAIGNWGPVFDRGGRTLLRWVFDLHLYRSSEGRWATRRMSVKDLVRDAAIPLPDSDMLYHETGRAFSVGGERGTVAWVDLWRGVLFLDVLARPRPVIRRDVPLPVPARENWGLLGGGRNPGYIRDVAISRRRRDTISIKYVEMEIQPSRVVTVRTLPDSYHEWVRRGCVSRRSHVIPGSWKATMWSMAAVPGGGVGSSWTDWKIECEVEAKDVAVDGGGGGLLSKLSGRATLPEVPVAYPTLTADDDTVYLLSSTESRGELVVAVDLRNKTLRRAAKLDAQKTFCSMPTYCASEICRYLSKSTAGKREELERKPTEVRVRQRQQLMTSR